MKTIFTTIGLVVLLLAGAIGLGYVEVDGIFGVNPEKTTSYVEYAYNVLGTKTGTSTAPYNFYTAATTSSVVKINPEWDLVTFTVFSSRASSTGSYINMQLLGSNDYLCDTATTTSVGQNNVRTTDINWVNIGYNVNELAGTLTPGTATSTWSWIPSGGKMGRAVSLDNANFECIKAIIGGNKIRTLIQARGK